MCCAFYDNRYNYIWIIIYFLVKYILQGILKNTVIPLPPIPKQKCIIQKVEQLQPLCDQLK